MSAQQNGQYFAFVFGPVEPILAIDILMLVVALVGLGFNGLLLYMTKEYRRVSRALDTTLIQVISTSDALTSLFMSVSIVLRWAIGDGILVNDGLWCRISSILFGGATLIALVFSALLGLARYLVIARGWAVDNKRCSVAAYLLAAFIICEFVYLAFRFRVTVPPSGLYCLPRFWDHDYSSRFVGLTALFLLVFTLFTIPLSYFGITLHYHKMIGRMGGIKDYRHIWRIRRSTYFLLLIVFCYSVATFPEFILIGLSLGGTVTRTNLLDGIVILLLSTTTIVNAIFSLMMHDDIHRIFLRHLGISHDLLGQPLP
ncbi:hypothetical protein L0F63_007003 [Massospora cicadina]|nr:hypothetical protein L0F63_007003 [Massospora cicadina]